MSLDPSNVGSWHATHTHTHNLICKIWTKESFNGIQKEWTRNTSFLVSVANGKKKEVSQNSQSLN